MHHASFTPRSGFSLAELSISLVIVGLLIGLIISGQDLLLQTRMNALPSQINQFDAAGRQFQLKYEYLPGDLPTATDTWGVAAGSGTDIACFNSGRTSGIATCNGNGNGRVLNYVGGATSGEQSVYWQHLSNAGMIEDYYSGVTDSALTGLPRSEVEGTRINVEFIGYYDYAAVVLAGSVPVRLTGEHGHAMRVSNPTYNYGEVFTPVEARSLDAKFDDGSPGNGRIIAEGGDDGMTQNITTCTTAGDYSTATYDISKSTVGCIMLFRNLFTQKQ
jgi:prepilin-type N-terminal cleavage/methylation domain-containing protein